MCKIANVHHFLSVAAAFLGQHSLNAGTRLLLTGPRVAPISSGPVPTSNTKTSLLLSLPPIFSDTTGSARSDTPPDALRSSTPTVEFTRQAICRVSGRSNEHDHSRAILNESARDPSPRYPALPYRNSPPTQTDVKEVGFSKSPTRRSFFSFSSRFLKLAPLRNVLPVT